VGFLGELFEFELVVVSVFLEVLGVDFPKLDILDALLVLLVPLLLEAPQFL
jgi:hypothetical protein